MVWVAFGVGFILIWSVYGAELGQQYFAGYLIEKSLAVDKVFVWAIIFAHFAVPRQYQHRVPATADPPPARYASLAATPTA